MGVKGLWTYIKDNEVSRKVELSLLAGRVYNETGKKPKLLCDFFNLYPHLWSPAVQALIKCGDYSDYTVMYGGDFHIFADRVRCFVAALKFIGIEPIFFVDAPRGSDESFEGKYPVLKQRYVDNVNHLEQMQMVCNGSIPIYKYIHCHYLLIKQVLISLKQAGVEVIFCCGEADPEIICYAQSHEETCGILSSDSDFAITSGSIMFPIEYLDIEGTLGLNGVFIDDKPGEIVCKVVCPTDIATHFGIRDNQLPDLAALCGNDYTRDVLNRFSVLTILGVEGSDCESVAKWLQDKEMLLLDYQPMKDLCIQYPELRIALEQSYSTYTAGSPASVYSPLVSYASPVYPLVLKEALSGTMMSSFLALAKCGISWLSLCCESITLGHPCLSDILLPVRKVMYTLLGLTGVREFGRTQHHTFDEVIISVCENPSQVEVGIECFHTLRMLDSQMKLVGLYRLMTRALHVKSVDDVKKIVESIVHGSFELPQLSWPIMYQMTMLCSCLKLLPSLNQVSRPPLNLSETELDALLVSCLTCSTGGEIPPQLTHLKPSMRSISIGEWFSSILVCCYDIASLLHLNDSRPEPRNLFYPMVFASYHISLEAKPDLKEEHKVSTEYIRAVMQAAIDLTAVKALRSALFDINNPHTLSSLVSLFVAAQEEIMSIQEILLPQSIVVDTGELLAGESVLPDVLESQKSEVCLSEGDNVGVPMVTKEQVTSNPKPENVIDSSIQGQRSDITHESLLELDQSKETHDKGLGPPPVLEKLKLARGMGLSRAQDSLKARLWGRRELPIIEHREKILKLISMFKAVCIEGETGCGKSSQVPQFILQEASMSNPPKRVRILVNQPSILAAKKLAERVAEERQEMLGTTVGYCSELERCPKDGETSLTFCTTDYMLQILQSMHTSCTFTHIILDEIHERSTDIDFTMLIVRQLAVKYPELKVVLMSATLQGNLFNEYFQQKLCKDVVASPVFVGMMRFPVTELCIDELDRLISHKEDQKQYDAMKKLQHQLKQFATDPSVLPLMEAEVSSFAQDVCVNLLISQPSPGDSILVFLPGTSDISDFYDYFHRKARNLYIRDRFRIFIFHNQAPREDQEEAFMEPIPGTATIILANRSAESSLTFPNLKMVVNFGVSKVAVYNTQQHVTRLTRRWCSHASCIQRAGRVGRVSEGIAIHLIPRAFYEELPRFNPPEIIDAPLSKTFLKAKDICCTLGMPLPSFLLSSVIQPPTLIQFEAALHDLANCGALVHSPHDKISENADTTLLGRFSASVPLDLSLCRLIFLGILFGCPLDGVVFAAAMSMYQDVFTLPTKRIMRELDLFCQSLARSTLTRMKFDDHCYSNPIMMRNMFIEWLKFKTSAKNYNSSRRQVANRFCKKYAVRVGRLLHFEAYVADIARCVMECAPSGSLLHLELDSLSKIESSWYGDPQLCDSSFFAEDGALKPSLRPTYNKYIPPALRGLHSQLRKSKFNTIHFCSSYKVLKALIAAASTTFLCGERACESHRPSCKLAAQRALKMMETEQFSVHRSLAMDLTELEDLDLWEEELDKTDKAALEKLFGSLPRGYRFPVQISTDEKMAIVHFQPCSLESSSHSLSLIASDIGISGGGDVASLPLEVEFYWRFGEQNAMWEIDNVNSRFPAPFHPCALMWYKLTEDRLKINSVSMNWRNPTAHLCLIDKPSMPCLAVASKLLSTSNVFSQLATNITLLPSGPEGLFILLAFQPSTSTVELLVDIEQKGVREIKINSLHIPCKEIDRLITSSRLDAINKLRTGISTVMTLPLSNRRIPLSNSLIKQIPKLLQNVLTTECGTPRQPTSLYADPKAYQGAYTDLANANTVNLMWETVSPGTLLKSNTPRSLSSTFGFPEYHCSILGTKPYSSKAMQHDCISPVTYSVTYTPTVAARILAKQVEQRCSNDSEAEPSSGSLQTIEAKGRCPKWRGDPVNVVTLGNRKMAQVWTGNEETKQDVSTIKEPNFAKHGQLKLEQEVVRYLQRNNKMEFFSELVVQRRINFLCTTYELSFDINFFHCRPDIFDVKEIKEDGETEGTSEPEFLIVLHPSRWDGDDDIEDGEKPLFTKSMQLIQLARSSASVRKEVDSQFSKPTSSKASKAEGQLASEVQGHIDRQVDQEPSGTDVAQENDDATLCTAIGAQESTKPQATIPGTNQEDSDKTLSENAIEHSHTDSTQPQDCTVATCSSAAPTPTGQNEDDLKSPSVAVNKSSILSNTGTAEIHTAIVNTTSKKESSKVPFEGCQEESSEVIKGSASSLNDLSSSQTSGSRRQENPALGACLPEHKEPPPPICSLPKTESKADSKPSFKRTKPSQPGTDEHLANYLMDVISTHGGVMRLAFLKQEYRLYHDKYWRYGTQPFLRKAFLASRPERFQFHKEESGMVFVRVVGTRHSSPMQDSRTTKKHSQVPVTAAPLPHSQHKEENMAPAASVEDMKLQHQDRETCKPASAIIVRQRR